MPRVPVNSLSAAIFRIMFFAAMVFESLRYLSKGWIRPLFVDPGYFFRFPLIPLDLPRLSEAAATCMFVTLAAAATLAAVGIWQRLSSLIVAFLLTYLFLYDAAYSLLLNHLYLLVIVAWILALCPQSRLLTLRLGKTPRATSTDAPDLAMYLLRFQILVVYFYAGVAKVNGHWLSGRPLAIWLAPLGLASMAQSMAWAGLALDLALPFLLLMPRTRPVAVLAAIIFHTLNSQLFHIGVFPVVAIGMTLLFLKGDWLARFLPQKWLQASTTSKDFTRKHAPLSPVTLALACLFVLIQIALPMRPWFYPGDSNLTEEGRFFSWRMMSTKKTGAVSFTLVNSDSYQTATWDPHRDLTELQINSMATQPELARQYAHHVAEVVEASEHFRPLVKVSMGIKMNGGPEVQILDSTRDLASEPFSLHHYDWIVAP